MNSRVQTVHGATDVYPERRWHTPSPARGLGEGRREGKPTGPLKLRKPNASPVGYAPVGNLPNGLGPPDPNGEGVLLRVEGVPDPGWRGWYDPLDQ